MKTTLKCTIVQKTEKSDLVVMEGPTGKIDVIFPIGQGDAFFKAGKQYDVEFKENSGIHLLKNEIVS